MHFYSLATAAIAALAAAVSASPVADWGKGGSAAAAGAVFAMTNAVQNEIVAFSRAADGKLTQTGKYATQGNGIGVDFDTQNGLILSHDNKFLYAANPASDDVTVFGVSGSQLKFLQRIPAGDQPLSITTNGKDLLYVMSGSVASNGLTGFKVQNDSTLAAIPKSTIGLSSPIAVPGVAQFSPDGKFIVVTHKVGSNLDIFKVGSNGLLRTPITISSAGLRPFAATFGADGHLFVIESGLPVLGNAAVSSYSVDDTSGALLPVTRSEKNFQTDGCWIQVTPNGKFAYTANFVSGTISSYYVASSGAVTIKENAAADLGPESNVVDLAITLCGDFIYNLLRGTGAVAGWSIGADGALTSVGTFDAKGDIPVANGASGLAAY
ncbi:hypothetical protein V502_03624 [Pseudogymnoascus sp. VKM F-4520 (FW-2644)]|nr:hypothetical protein V502_03624 [Pseudogymnoascus sp. VKM F-4520 (FW-2644)]